jgi:hypothetical protein
LTDHANAKATVDELRRTIRYLEDLQSGDMLCFSGSDQCNPAPRSERVDDSIKCARTADLARAIEMAQAR